MKPSRFIALTIAFMATLFISSAPALAQTEQEKKVIQVKIAEEKAAVAQAAELQAKIQAEVQAQAYAVIESKLAFETKVVKGAPYSAVAVSESVQVLGDGNRIRQVTTTTVYRDSAGRTRREVMKKDGTLQSIVINDPSAGVNYQLDPQRRTAMKNESPVIKKVANVSEEELQRRREVELRTKLEAEKKIVAVENSANAVPLKKRAPVKESLGRQMIEGIEAEGTRITTVIPAGEIGNDLPINIISEQWYSPELQLLVMTKHSDPRTGETTYRLTGINRAEPDQSLFQVPSDYTIDERRKVIEEVRVKAGKPLEN